MSLKIVKLKIRSFIMRFFQTIRIIIVLIFVFMPNQTTAKILWSKDLLDVNTNSVPLASCLNKDANGIIVMTRGCPKGKFPVGEGSLALWEIGIDGTTTRTEPKDVNGSRVRTNGDSVGVGGCAMISNNFGDILTVGILNKSGEKRQKIAIVSKADKAKMTLTPNS